MSDTIAQGRGRLTPERTQEVHDTVLALVVEKGYEGLTVDAIAHGASISKATLYRQWGGKQNLVIDALESTHPHIGTDQIDTGSLRGDLCEWVRLSEQGPHKDIGLVHAILHACTTNDDLAQAMRDRMINQERSSFDALFTRAAERGEIAADAPALAYLPITFVGAYFLREFVDGTPPDEAYMIGLVDSVVLPALGIHWPLSIHLGGTHHGLASLPTRTRGVP